MGLSDIFKIRGCSAAVGRPGRWGDVGGELMNRLGESLGIPSRFKRRTTL